MKKIPFYAIFFPLLFLFACQSHPRESVTITVSSAVSTQTQSVATQMPFQELTDTIDEISISSPSETAAMIPSPSPTTTPLASTAVPIGGVEFHDITENTGLSLINTTRSHWIRYNGLLWSQAEAMQGVLDWNAQETFDQELLNAADAGYEVILIVRSAPEWARLLPNKACGPIKPEALAAFGEFLFEAVNRYSVPPYNVTYWELGNEPDVDWILGNSKMPFGCWGDVSDPYYGGGYYAEMLKVAYPQIKAANPNAQVLIGGLLLDCDPVNPPEIQAGSGEYRNCASAQFLEGVLQNGGGDFFDGVSFHAYDYFYGTYGYYGNTNWHSDWQTTGPTLSAKVKYLRRLLGIYGYPQKSLLNTEMALLCGKDGSDPICKSDDFNQTKANFAAEAYAAARANGLLANIWYSIAGGWRASGLTVNMQPTPAFYAYQFSLEMLDQANFVRQINDYSGLLGYEFQRGDTRFWLIWALDGQAHTLEVATPSAIYDIYGNLQPSGEQIEITLNPSYIEWGP